MRRDYELGFILNPEVNEEQTRAILERVEQVVANHDGQVVRVNQWGRRRLAYPIQHRRDGFYVFIDMILPPETVSELDRTLKVSEEVMRHMITKRDAKAVQKEREDQREREARAAAAEQARAAAETSAAPAPATATEAAVPATTGVEDEMVAPASQENEAPIELTEDDLNYVPPAIEDEETVEA